MKKGKLYPLSILSIFIFIIALFSGCAQKKADTTMVNVKLNEVTRSVFYAPMYVAINEGFFKEEDINIDLTTGQGADTAVFKTQVL